MIEDILKTPFRLSTNSAQKLAVNLQLRPVR